MMIQLNPLIPLITPKGKAWAHFVIDYSQDTALLWVCFQDDTGECWIWQNNEIRIQHNYTMKRSTHSEIKKRNG